MHLRRWLAVPLAVPAAFAVFSLFLPAAQASVGVGVQAAPVRLGNVAHAGGSYALPPVYVINTGTQPEKISVRVERLSKGTGRAVPPSWIQATGSGVQLSPRQSARLPLELVVPGGAKPGRYLSDVVVGGSAVISAGRANLGVAAATRLEFSVAPGSPPGFFPFGPSWMWWAAIGLLVLALAITGARRSGVRIRIERTPSGLAHASAGRGAGPGARRSTTLRGGPRLVVALVAVAGLAACATSSGGTPAGTPGKGSSIAISLKVVSTIVSVTVSPSSANFGGCAGGNASVNTASTSAALGFPNGHCSLGTPGGHGSFPITITNTGVAADVYVNGGNAVPSDKGTEWGLCNFGTSPASKCSADDGKLPGNNQYVVQNFASGSMNPAGLTGSMTCDTQFAAGGCSAVQGDAQAEGILLTGPASSSDQSTTWTVTIIWTAVSLG
jgi:hypothetical protein